MLTEALLYYSNQVLYCKTKKHTYLLGTTYLYFAVNYGKVVGYFVLLFQRGNSINLQKFILLCCAHCEKITQKVQLKLCVEIQLFSFVTNNQKFELERERDPPNKWNLPIF